MSTYNPKNWNCILGGHLLEGWGDSTVISITKDSETSEDMVGVDGEVVVGIVHDNRATGEITLMRTSPSNKILSDLYNAFKDSPNGHYVAFRLVNRAGSSEHKAAKAWVLKAPDPTLEKSPTTVTWKIRMANLKETHAE